MVKKKYNEKVTKIFENYTLLKKFLTSYPDFYQDVVNILSTQHIGNVGSADNIIEIALELGKESPLYKSIFKPLDSNTKIMIGNLLISPVYTELYLQQYPEFIVQIMKNPFSNNIIIDNVINSFLNNIIIDNVINSLIKLEQLSDDPRYDLKTIILNGNFTNDHLEYLMLNDIFAQEAVPINPENIIYYKGSSEKVIQAAIDSGLKITDDIIMKNFQLTKSPKIQDLMVAQGYASKDTIKKILMDSFQILDSNYQDTVKLLLLKEDALEIILSNTDYTMDVLKRYAFTSPNFKYLIKIANDGKIVKFNELYKNLISLFPYEAEYVQGINFYLELAKNYCNYEELLLEINEYLKSGYDLTKSQIYNLRLLFKTNQIYRNINLSNLDTVYDTMINEFISKMKDSNTNKRDLLCEFITGYTYEDFRINLSHLGDQLVFKNIYENAQSDEVRKLAFELYSMLQYCSETFMATNNEETLYNLCIDLMNYGKEYLLTFKSQFANYRTKLRYLFEAEANEKLTPIHKVFKVEESGDIKCNEEYLPKGAKVNIVDGIPVIHMENSEYTLYAHVVSREISDLIDINFGEFYANQRCVSPISDLGKKLYDNKYTVGYSYIEAGNYIGSCNINMGSTAIMHGMKYDDSGLIGKYYHLGIRETTLNLRDGHAETILWRDGMYPSCVIHRDNIDLKDEIAYAKELSKEISKKRSEESGTDVKVIIPVVITQLEGTKSQVPSENKSDKKINYIEELSFVSISHDEVNNIITQDHNYIGGTHDLYKCKLSDKKGYYFLKPSQTISGNVVDFKPYVSEIAYKLQTLINPENAMEIIILEAPVGINGQKVLCTATQYLEGAEDYSNWQKSQSREPLSKKEIVAFMFEFIVDHLIYNYDTKGENFLKDNSGKTYGIDKEQGLRYILEDKNSGMYTTEFLDDDPNSRNNYRPIYFDIFEDYRNGKQEIDESTFNHCLKKCKEIQEMDDTEYIQLFKEYFEKINYSDSDRRIIIDALLERKNSLVTEYIKFLEKLKQERSNKNNE